MAVLVLVPVYDVTTGRMLQNWDFHMHRVSKESAAVIDQIVSIPMLHMTALAPDLHLYVGTLDRVRRMRHQLSGLCRYLNTCKKVSETDGWKRATSKFKNKEYLLEHTDIYSVQDLVRVHMDLLGTDMRECVTEGISHVKSCPVCQAQAYICEVATYAPPDTCHILIVMFLDLQPRAGFVPLPDGPGLAVSQVQRCVPPGMQARHEPLPEVSPHIREETHSHQSGLVTI